jgi:hypothetical protein
MIHVDALLDRRLLAGLSRGEEAGFDAEMSEYAVNHPRLPGRRTIPVKKLRNKGVIHATKTNLARGSERRKMKN